MNGPTDRPPLKLWRSAEAFGEGGSRALLQTVIAAGPHFSAAYKDRFK